MTYADSKTNIGITVGRRRTWLIAIPCSLPRFAQVHDRIWTRHERKLGTNMRRHDVAVSRQNALAYWLCRSAPEVPRVSVDWLAQISSSTIKQAVKWKKKKQRKRKHAGWCFIQHLLHSLSILHSSTASTNLCLTTLDCKGRLPLEALLVSLGCVLLCNGPVWRLQCTAGPVNGALICSSPLLWESLSLPLPFLGSALQLAGNEMSVFTPSPDY